MKVYAIYLALCSLTQAVYISRMSSANRLRPLTPFRPGVNLQRPWTHTRLVQAASHRAPYVLYRKPPQRYAVKHFVPSPTRNMFAGGPWKTTGRLPPMAPVTPEYEFVKAASATPVVHTDGGTGAIHTIPAPNLSLSEKPIVVIENSDTPVSEQPRPSYEVTEKYLENEYSMGKIESPIGFSKSTSFTTPELQTLIRNGAALQLASEYSLPAMAINQHRVLPHQFPIQGLQNILPTHQDFINTGADGIFIPPNALFQHDPTFLQKLQSQLLQRFPSVEFIPYAAEAPNQVHLQPDASQAHTQVVHPQMMQPQVVHTQILHPQELHPQMILLENEQLDQPIFPHHNEQKTVVQRETQEKTVVNLVPQSFVAFNTTEKQADVTTSPQLENITVELVASETQSPTTTTIKYIEETNTEEQNTTPIYYAQIGQSVGSVIANGFYSAINDVRAAAALAQVENNPLYKPPENVTTTTASTDLKAYFVKNEEISDNKTATELKPLLGVPFTKSTDKVNVAYTLVRADDKQPKVNQEGAVYAGQIVEATISEDQDFNNQKATFMSRRAPIRLFAVADTKNIASSANNLPDVTVVKAKIPPKSKLTFDDKTGEPILRIYASYVDSPTQKDAVVSKLKQIKDTTTRKDAVENWKAAVIKSVADKSQGFDANQVAQFGLKLKERNDYYEPFFEEYEDL